jgi:hypothetical protein
MMSHHGFLWGCLGLAVLWSAGCENGYDLWNELKDLTKGGDQTEPVPPANPDVVTGEEGGPTSCKPVYIWKDYVSQTCAAAGLQLAGYTPREDCGDGNFRYVKYECRKPAPPTVPVPNACKTETQGGETSCKPVAIWKGYAADTCQAAGLVLTQYTPVEACGDGSYRYVKYNCCEK